MSSETVVFKSRRIERFQRVQGARHVVVGLLLASSGVEAFKDGHHASWIDVVAIVSGVLLLAAFVVEIRRSRSSERHHHHGIGWVDVFASAVTAVEAAHLFHKGKVGLPFVYLLLAAILLALGLAHGRLQQLRRLIVDEHGFDIRLSPWRRVQRRWVDVTALTAAGSVVTVTERGGAATTINLRDVPQAAAVISALTRHADAALGHPVGAEERRVHGSAADAAPSALATPDPS